MFESHPSSILPAVASTRKEEGQDEEYSATNNTTTVNYPSSVLAPPPPSAHFSFSYGTTSSIMSHNSNIHSSNGSNSHHSIDSSVAFSMHHLHDKDSVMVEKEDAAPSPVPPAVGGSVISHEPDNEEEPVATTARPFSFRPFWNQNGALKNDGVEEEEEEEETKNEKKEETEKVATGDLLGGLLEALTSNEKEAKNSSETKAPNTAEDDHDDEEPELLCDDFSHSSAHSNTIIWSDINWEEWRDWIVNFLLTCKDTLLKFVATGKDYLNSIEFSSAWVGRPEWKATGYVLGGITLVLALYSLVSKHPWFNTTSPKDDLRAFVMYEKAQTSTFKDQELVEMETDVFQVFARSACVQAKTAELAKAALLADLKGIPDPVRHDVVEMAIKEGVTQKSSLQDSKADLVDKGKAFSFMAFWSTAYNPQTSKPHQTYETCLMATVVNLTVSETVAEWTLKEEKYQIGVEPCYCGPISCAECPVFDTRVVQWPILERRSLPLKKQRELRQWMVNSAIESAAHLIASPYYPFDLNLNIDGDNSGKNQPKKWSSMSHLSWSKTQDETLPSSADHVVGGSGHPKTSINKDEAKSEL